MNQKKSFSHLEIHLETLETLWVQHSGFLERITQESGVNFYYQEHLIILVGNINYCENAAQRIYSKIYEDFIMQIEQFRSNEEMKPFYQLFQQPQYKEISKSNQGFWIYSAQSLMKQYLNMEQRGYQSSFPDLPQHFLITWFPKRKMLFLQQQIFQMIGFRYNQQSLNSKFRFDAQYNVTALEAISIYLNMDLQEIMDQYQLLIELNQIQNQFFLTIKANNRISINQTVRILENHLERRKFWHIAYLQINLSSNNLSYLKKNLNDQIRSNSVINLYTYEEVIRESKCLDQQFDINLNEIIVQRQVSPDSLFVFGDYDKQDEITDTIIQIVRKLRKIESNHNFVRRKVQINHFYGTLRLIRIGLFPIKITRRISIRISFHFMINPSNVLFNRILEPVYNQQSNHYYYPNNNLKGDIVQNEDQTDIPLRNYKKYYKKHDNNQSKNKNYNQRRYRQRQREQEIQDVDVSLYVAKVAQNNYVFQYPVQQQEEEKSSQLLFVEELNKVIKCQVIKIELFQYQIIYTQNNCKNNLKINFTEFKSSFEEFQKKYYNLQPELILEFYTDNIKISVQFMVIIFIQIQYQFINCKQKEDIDAIKKIFHKYFLQQLYNLEISILLYYVTQYSTQTLSLVDILKLNCHVEYFSTKTELSGFLNETEFLGLVKIQDGQQMAIKISNFSYRNHQLLREKFKNFEISQSFLQNSSILDISRQGANSKKVIICSEEQLLYLNQEFADLEAFQLRKFKEFFKMPFYFVQIEYIEELLEQAKVEFKIMNEKYVKAQVQAKEKENKTVWIKEIKKDQSYQASKLYCYNMIEAFNLKLLNDINEISMNTEEYQANSNLSMYYEAIIDLGDRELNPNDSESIENLLFYSDYKVEPKEMKLIDLPIGTFITVWIRHYSNDTEKRINNIKILQSEEIQIEIKEFHFYLVYFVDLILQYNIYLDYINIFVLQLFSNVQKISN